MLTEFMACMILIGALSALGASLIHFALFHK